MNLALVCDRELLVESDIFTDAWRRLVVDLEACLGTVARITHRLAADEPADFILIMSVTDIPTLLRPYPAATRAALATRLVPLMEAQSRAEILDDLVEPLDLPAAIDDLSLAEWCIGSRAGFFGRRDLCMPATSPFTSERYCYVRSPSPAALPAMLAHYLRTLHSARA